MQPKTVLITGASGGLGAALARELAGDGVRLVLHCHRNRQAVDALALSIKGADVFQADLSGPDGCAMLLEAVTDWAPGGIDWLVHAAGGVADAPVVGLSESDWDGVVGAHLSAPWYLLDGGVMALGGGVVLIGSGAGSVGRRGQAAYAAAKAGMAAMTEVLARDFAKGGIHINTVIPGPVDTPMWQALDAAAREAVISKNALAQLNTPEQVAAFIHVVLQMPATTGQVLSIGSRLPEVL